MEPFAYLKKMQFINGTICLSKKNTVRKWNHVKKCRSLMELPVYLKKYRSLKKPSAYLKNAFR